MLRKECWVCWAAQMLVSTVNRKSAWNILLVARGVQSCELKKNIFRDPFRCPHRHIGWVCRTTWSALLITMRAGINAFRIPSNFLTYMTICIRIEFRFIAPKHSSRMCIRICYTVNSCEKREVRVSNSKSMVLRIVHVCCIEIVIQVLKLQSPSPPTEPQNPKTPKVHSKVRKNAILDPPEKGPQKSTKMSKKPIFRIKMSEKMGFLDILIDFWGPFFGGVQNGTFRTLKCIFGVLGFRGSVGGLGDCNPKTKACDVSFPVGMVNHRIVLDIDVEFFGDRFSATFSVHCGRTRMENSRKNRQKNRRKQICFSLTFFALFFAFL